MVSIILEGLSIMFNGSNVTLSSDESDIYEKHTREPKGWKEQTWQHGLSKLSSLLAWLVCNQKLLDMSVLLKGSKTCNI